MIKSLEELQKWKVPQVLSDFLDTKFGVSKESNATLIQSGFWHVGYFAQARAWANTSSSWLGLRFIPGKELTELPVVATKDFGGITISPSLKDLIPNLILYFSVEPGDIEVIRENWDSTEDALYEAHSNLGGDQKSLVRLKEYIFNVDNFETDDYKNKRTRSHSFLYVDKTPETTNFRNFIQVLINNEKALPEFKENFGAWTDYAKSAIASRAYTIFVGKEKSLDEVANSIWLSFNKAAPFDSDIPGFTPIKQFIIDRNPTNVFYSFMVSLINSGDIKHLPQHIQDDPLFDAAHHLATIGFPTAYTGVEHMEAAQRFDEELNDGQRSYEALISAAFWSAQSLGFPYKESYQAALMLAEKYGWDEMHDLLEQNTFDLQKS
jgi:hypothetical protein